MWVGVDDTDSPVGGCTTYVLTEIVALARDQGIDLLGDPRLVRLNPNIPWKTRGNAALSARFGHGHGARTRVGEIDGRPVWSFRRGRPLSVPEKAAFLEDAWGVVRRAAEGGDPASDPALVALERRPGAAAYWQAVREEVDPEEVRRALELGAAWVRWQGTPRGLVGARASIAWAGGHPTWEVIAYRQRPRWGTPREVNGRSVRSAQRDYPNLFLCFDPRTRRILVAPHTACPILFGLRATDPESPLRALRRIRSEPVDRWIRFRTNQGSGDHLVGRPTTPWPAWTSGTVRGQVVGPPVVQPGGHVRFEVADRAGAPLSCVAFEPTKTLPRIARALTGGDQVRVWGSRGTEGTLRLEGIEVVRWAASFARRTPPRCPRCHRRAVSAGRVRGFRCRSCRTRLPPEAAQPVLRPPPFPVGTYHPTPSARRHLAPRAPES
ncbi:MAG: tRNA(Ile)(2)-agmatinylcytidine synthase [Thermoplasmata archaeon]|nr:tRNA(Ile)(2)-agmatinylcytidine synthase [Thermoplasmata archaeon]